MRTKKEPEMRACEAADCPNKFEVKSSHRFQAFCCQKCANRTKKALGPSAKPHQKRAGFKEKTAAGETRKGMARQRKNKATPETRTCPGCGDPFEVATKSSDRIYCNGKCANNHHRQTPHKRHRTVQLRVGRPGARGIAI